MIDQQPSPDRTACPGCGSPTVTVADRHGRPVVLTADPDPSRGTVWIHGITGRLVAQTLGADAAKAYRRARHPVYTGHRCPDAAR